VNYAISHVLCVQPGCVDGKHLGRVGLQSSLAEGRAAGGALLAELDCKKQLPASVCRQRRTIQGTLPDACETVFYPQ
jgi:hypothetical protein